MHEDRERGQTATEMAVLVALCSLLVIVAIVFFRTALADVFRGGQKTTAAFRPPRAYCDANYSGGCVPPHPPDVDCADLEALGIGQVTITGSDPHGLDPDGDGIGCD